MKITKIIDLLNMEDLIQGRFHVLQWDSRYLEVSLPISYSHKQSLVQIDLSVTSDSAVRNISFVGRARNLVYSNFDCVANFQLIQCDHVAWDQIRNTYQIQKNTLTHLQLGTPESRNQ